MISVPYALNFQSYSQIDKHKLELDLCPGWIQLQFVFIDLAIHNFEYSMFVVLLVNSQGLSDEFEFCLTDPNKQDRTLGFFFFISNLCR